MPSKTISGVLRCLVLVTSVAALSTTALAQQQLVPTVTVQAATPKDFTLKARLPGRIKASTVAEVRPQVSGIILERLFDEGARVVEGQPLYKIDDQTYVAAVLSAKASVGQAQADYDLAVIQSRRAEDLFDKQTGSASSRDNAIATRNKADATLQMTKAQLTTAEINLQRTTIRAPLTGVIGFSQTTAGALVSAEQAASLTTIRALDPIYVDVTQSATDLLRWIASGGSSGFGAADIASMILPDGKTYPHKGELKAAEPQVVPTTGMVTLRIAFPNPDHMLLPGLYVEVELPQATTKDAILVPQSAVMRNTKGEPFAWVVDDGKVAVRPLSILTNSGSNWVTISGLKAGDNVITSGFQKIAPGASVQIEQAAAGSK